MHVNIADMLNNNYSYEAKIMSGAILKNKLAMKQESEGMATPLSTYLRQRIVIMWMQGQNPSSIVRILSAEGRDTTRTTIKKWIFRWEEQSSHDVDDLWN